MTATKKPKKNGSPNFKFINEYGFYEIENWKTRFAFSFGGITISGDIIANSDWDGLHDISEASNLFGAIPLHWHVYSLEAEVTHFKYNDAKTNEQFLISERKRMFAYQDTLWGSYLGEDYVRGNGIKQYEDKKEDTLGLAMSFGPMNGLFNVDAYLVFYQNKHHDLNWNFRYTNSKFEHEIDACQGKAKFVSKHMIYRRRLEFEFLFEDVKDTDVCITGATYDGFQPSHVQSFEATLFIKSFEDNYLFPDRLLDIQVVNHASFEMAGKFQCNPCKKEIEHQEE